MPETSERILRTTPAVPVKGGIVPQSTFFQKEEADTFPFRDYVDSHIPTFSVIQFTRDIEKPGYKNNFELSIPSVLHGRSSEVNLSPDGQIGLVWSDENGIVFGSVNIKGNNLENPRIQKDKYSPTGFRVRGLQEAPSLSRITEVSRILRKRGVETEKIEQVIKPLELIYKGKRVSIEDFKKRLLDSAREDIQKNKAIFLEPSEDERALSVEDLERIEELINTTEFYFSVRGQQLTERFRDLERPKTEEEFRTFISKVFSFINVREEIEAKKEERATRKLEAGSEEDVNYYFTDYLPRRLAVNIAKMHNAGLTHGFLTSHNVSLAGSIYDLDSVYGALVGDSKQPAPEEDIDIFIREMINVFCITTYEATGIISMTYFKKKLGENFAPSFFRTFVRTYLQTRVLEVNFEETQLFTEKQVVTEVDKSIQEAKEKGLTAQTLLSEIERDEKENGSLAIRWRRGDAQSAYRTAFKKLINPRISKNYKVYNYDYDHGGVAKIVSKAIKAELDKKVKDLIRKTDISFYEDLRKRVYDRVRRM